jgi:hypothetical protein
MNPRGAAMALARIVQSGEKGRALEIAKWLATTDELAGLFDVEDLEQQVLSFARQLDAAEDDYEAPILTGVSA